MAEVGHNLDVDNGYRNATPSSFTNVNTNSRINALQIDASSEYLVIITALISANSTSANVVEFRVHSTDLGGDGELAFSRSRIESRRVGTNNGHQYFYMERYDSDASPDDIDMQYDSDGVTQAQQQQWTGWNIKLDDLTENTNFWWDEDLTSLSSLDNSGWTDGASVTIGDGTSDYIVYFSGHCLVDGAGTDIRMNLEVGGVDYTEVRRQGEDAVESYCMGGMVVLEAPSASTVVKLQFQTSSGTAGLMDIDCSRIFVLKLNAFEDYFTGIVTTDTPITAVDTDTNAGTVTHTTDTVATEDWAIQAMAMNDCGEHTKRTEHRIMDASIGLLAGDSTISMMENGSSDLVPLPLFGQENLADATSLDIDYIVREEGDVSPQPNITDVWFVGFSYELADVATGGDQAGSLALTGVGY